jgi:RND family efflux transporter MFP subunit
MKLNVSNLTATPKFRLFAGLALAIAIVLGVIWLVHRAGGQPSVPDGATDGPTAGVAKVTREDLYKEVNIAAEFRPYVEAVLHSKVTGYVSNVDVDFGDKVKTGQILATIEVPELQDELDNAEAAKAKAEADHTNADLIYARLTAVNQDHPNLVAQQDLDTASANDRTTQAATAAANAEVEKYQTLIGYTKIVAPFDGVVTRRYADPGALIQAGTGSEANSMPVVRVSDNYHLRLDFPVTVDYVKDVHVGAPVQVRVESLDGRTFTGNITRFTSDVDDTTRTMITEVEVTNADLALVPGMYATVSLKVENHPGALAVPVQAVNGGKVPTVTVVNPEDKIEVRTVTLGLETPDKDEVLSGLHEGELVVIGDHSGFQPGQKVKPQLLQASGHDEN